MADQEITIRMTDDGITVTGAKPSVARLAYDVAREENEEENRRRRERANRVERVSRVNTVHRVLGREVQNVKERFGLTDLEVHQVLLRMSSVNLQALLREEREG